MTRRMEGETRGVCSTECGGKWESARRQHVRKEQGLRVVDRGRGTREVVIPFIHTPPLTVPSVLDLQNPTSN